MGHRIITTQYPLGHYRQLGFHNKVKPRISNYWPKKWMCTTLWLLSKLFQHQQQIRKWDRRIVVKAILRSSRVIYADNQCVKSVVILHREQSLAASRHCQRWLAGRAAVPAAAACVLMPCQESRRLNDDPRFTAHEPKWCLSGSIKGLIPSKEGLIIAVGSLSGTTLKRSQWS